MRGNRVFGFVVAVVAAMLAAASTKPHFDSNA